MPTAKPMAAKGDYTQMPVSMPAETLRELRKVALDLQEHVPRDRLMDRGPMMFYLASWFLTLTHDEQLGIILAGKKASEGLPHEFDAFTSPRVTMSVLPIVEAEAPKEVGAKAKPRGKSKPKG